MAPIPSSDASVYKMNGLLKLEYIITDAVTSLAFMTSKAFYLISDYSNGTGLPFSSLISSYIGLFISKNPLIYCQ